MDLVLKAAVGAAPLGGLSHGADEVVSEPEGLVQLVAGHPLTQLLQHQAPLALTRPHTLGQNDQALGRLWRRLFRWFQLGFCWGAGQESAPR